MFNGLDQLFVLSNLRYEYEARKILYFAKHDKRKIDISLFDNFIGLNLENWTKML
jgi:hypothetical protein